MFCRKFLYFPENDGVSIYGGVSSSLILSIYMRKDTLVELEFFTPFFAPASYALFWNRKDKDARNSASSRSWKKERAINSNAKQYLVTLVNDRKHSTSQCSRKGEKSKTNLFHSIHKYAPWPNTDVPSKGSS